jgi:dTDP-4-dehydrorhamnose reductase
MKNVLVAGANGQLGQCIQKIAPKYSNFKFSFKNSKELDITNAAMVNAIFESNEFDFCINCAAYTNVEQAEKNPAIAYGVNAEGTKNLAEACKEYQVTLIHISTDYVFDGEKQEAYTVKDVPNPINEYGKSKLLGEKFIQNILEKFYIIRTSWLYSEFGENFYKTILRRAKDGEPLQITDEQTGCPTNANNLAVYILDSLEHKLTNYGIYHFTDRRVMTWYEFAEKILNENNLGKGVKLVKDKNYCTFAKRPKNSTLQA